MYFFQYGIFAPKDLGSNMGGPNILASDTI